MARLGTVTADGRPHLVPCCFALDGDTFHTAVDGVKVKSTTALRRLDNVRVHPATSILVDHYDDDWTASGGMAMNSPSASTIFSPSAVAVPSIHILRPSRRARWARNSSDVSSGVGAR